VARSDVGGIDMLGTDLTRTFLLGVLAPVVFAFLYTLALRVTND
jgi:hypothetical protein